MTAIQAKCPDLTIENIINHEAWYKIYLNLREKQRSAVKEWRKQKQTEKENNKICEDQTVVESTEQIIHEKSNFDNTEKLLHHTTIKYETNATTPGNVVNTDCINRKKELIRQWKIERENKLSMEEQQLKILIESKLAVQEKRKQERLKRIQVALAEYHENKLTELSTKMSKDDSNTEQKYNPAMIKAFR